MTNEKMLEIAYSAKAGLTDPNDVEMCEFMEKATEEEAERYNKINYYAAAKIGYMINCLIHDIAKEADKKSVNGDAAKIITKYIKSHKKDAPIARATKIIDGKQYYCDGKVLFKLDKPLESLPIDDAITTNLEDMLKNSVTYIGRIELPTPQELKAKIAQDKAEWKSKDKNTRGQFVSRYDFGKGLPLVNAEYLLDALLIVGEEPVAHTKGDGCLMYFYSDKTGNEAIIMPIRRLRAV